MVAPAGLATQVAAPLKGNPLAPEAQIIIQVTTIKDIIL
jgi:hypothetical protein